MKKTLAAVLAAAMALSTATVAFATDIEVDFSETPGSVSGFREVGAKMGDTSNFRITTVTTEDGDVIDGAELARAMDEGDITATVVVVNNQSKLDGRPSITAGTYKTSSTNQAVTTVTKYYWKSGVNRKFTMEGAEFTAKGGKEVTIVYLGADGGLDIDEGGANTSTVLKKGDSNYDTLMAALMGKVGVGDWIESKTVAEKTPATVSGPFDGVQLKFKINHTYGTDSVTVGMKLRFTAKRDTTVDGIDLKKGDTLTSEQVNFKAQYNELSNYYRDMQLTTQEVKDNNVLLNGSNLYDKIGNETFSITFGDDVAMFTGKAAANQKTVNLYYSLGEIDAVKDAYPDVDFQFIEFKGNPVPTFAVTGDMVFAAWDKNTTVYEWDGEALTPISDPKNYDNTYKTITVKGIKRLGTYVIASEILEVEEEPEELAEPVESTPVAEPDNDEGGNPNTGAC